jgi:hypothetical protein
MRYGLIRVDSRLDAIWLIYAVRSDSDFIQSSLSYCFNYIQLQNYDLMRRKIRFRIPCIRHVGQSDLIIMTTKGRVMTFVGVSSEHLPLFSGEIFAQSLPDAQVTGSFNVSFDSQTGSVISRLVPNANEALRFTGAEKQPRAAPWQVLGRECDCKAGPGGLRDERSWKQFSNGD